MNDFKAAIFDLDGTLLDSMGIWEKIDLDFLTKRNLSIPETYMKEISSLSFKEAAAYTIHLFCLKETVEELINEWYSMAIHEYSHTIRLKPHAREYLIRLKSQGVKMGIATSLPKELWEPALKNNGILNDYFDVLCGAEEESKGKEYPDIFLLVSSRLAIPPDQCIVFEDLLQGIVSAKKAGMTAYGVYDSYASKDWSQIQKIADGYLYDFENAPIA